jgi:hypothetical protein
MKRSILFMLALTLIGSSALAQGAHVSGLNPPYAGATASAPTGVAAYGPSSAPTGVAAYGTSSGLQGTQFPYGIATTAFPKGTAGAPGMLDFYGTTAAVPPYAASPYATGGGVHDTQDSYGTGAATSRFGTSPAMGSPQTLFGTAQQYNPHPYGVPR